MRALVIPTLVNPQDLVPSGQISVWTGLIANIPGGWFLCDGQNSTPDLRDRFIIGASAATEAGGTGGSNSHSHDNHVSTQPSNHAALATHAHSTTLMNLAGAPSAIDKANFGQGVSMTATYEVDTIANTDVDNAHLTNVVSGGTPDAHAGAAVDAHNTAASKPDFFDVLYIMKA